MRTAVLRPLLRFSEYTREMSPSTIWARLNDNLGLRILSLMLAIALWLFVNAGQHSSRASFKVPISYRALPAGFVVVSDKPGFVKVEISGPPTLLSLIQPDRLLLRLDLSGVNVGQAVFKITPEMFNLPRHTTMTRLSPSQLVLDVDRLQTREVPIHLATSGEVGRGYRLGTVELVPSMARVRGPSRMVSKLAYVETEPFDVKGALADVSGTVRLANPGGGVVLLQDAMVQAHVTVKEAIADRQFADVDVEVRDTDYKVVVEPKQVTVSVRGPYFEVNKLDLKGAVYVEAEGIAPGLHYLPVQVSLPGGIELVRALPQQVKVKALREKQAKEG